MSKQLPLGQLNTTSQAAPNLGKRAPLAERMRPRTLSEVVGQEHITAENSAFTTLLRESTLPSIVLWGPPGTGKTTLARVIAAESKLHFVRLSGVLDGVKELREAVAAAETNLRQSGAATLALVDEIHRFNKAQQDAFLPHVESGLLTIVGQTTENVSFRIRNALLSRLRVYEVKPLSDSALQTILHRALEDEERGLGAWSLQIAPEAETLLKRFSGGDARRLLTGLEWSAARSRAVDVSEISAEIVTESYGSQPQLFDSSGDYHYDNASAFIKSMRGSDPDAALYYMLRALDSGEDPLFISRRMIIFASEDAACDPRALQIALDIDAAVQRVGMPEAKISLAHGVTYLASCPKSNASYMAMKAMQRVIDEHPSLPVPKRLRNAQTETMKELGYGDGYRYPHDYPGAFVAERYLPEELGDLRVYEPSDRGIEIQIGERLARLRAQIEREKE